MTDAELALHEAAHAVAAQSLGRKVLRLRLDAIGGATSVAPPAHRNDRRARREWLIITLAGAAAERLCAPPTPELGGWRL